jgi:aclacinomycin oxidase
VPDGTLVRIVCTDVPPGIREEDHAAGLASSLQNLAAFVERDGGAGSRYGPDSSQYRAVVGKRFNRRFAAARPDYVRRVGSPGQVEAALGDAVSEDRRVVVTSGGHCLEGFVADPDVRVILDTSPMKRVYFDAEHRAVAIEAGATVGDAFRALAEQWGIVVPLGEYPGVGIGGHVAGGAFGFLCRGLGLVADHLYGVEVVTVGGDGRPATVFATREPSDPNRELWWAHTGGGGGNFGVVTRYLFRSPAASGSDPRSLLPRMPESVTTFRAEWSWADLDERSFHRLVANHGAWSAEHSGPGSPAESLWSLLTLHRRELGMIVVRGLSTAGAGAARQIADYVDSVGNGIAPPRRETATMSWLEFALTPFPDLFDMPPGGVAVKVKDALLRRPIDERQISVAYEYLTDPAHAVLGGMLGFATYGGRVNAVAPDTTASAGRNAIFDMAVNAGWLDPAEGDRTLAWARGFYRDLFADTGGVPVPGERYDGALINHPDVDLADPAWNTSGVPWHTIYYQDNYPRLQRVKERWDPRNVFRHALSVRRRSSA